MKKNLPHISTKKLIIDGFNLMYKFETLHNYMKQSELSKAMEGLINIITKYQKKTSKKIEIVFDGKKGEGNSLNAEKRGPLSIRYSLNETADTLIMHFIKNEKCSADYTIISSDKQIISFVKRHKAKVCSSENFELIIKETLEAPSPKEIDNKPDIENLSAEEMGFWTNLFNV